MSELIEVSAALWRDIHGRVLLAERKMPGGQMLWEFPGGKREPGEPGYDCLCRELAEELGVQLQAAEAVLGVRQRSGSRLLQIEFYAVQAIRGLPQGMEGQRLMWAAPAELLRLRYPLADWPVAQALGLGRMELPTAQPNEPTPVSQAQLNRLR